MMEIIWDTIKTFLGWLWRVFYTLLAIEITLVVFMVIVTMILSH